MPHCSAEPIASAKGARPIHYLLAFHIPPDKSLIQREHELDQVFQGELNKYDGLREVDFCHVMAERLHFKPPYAFVDENDTWHEKIEGQTDHDWQGEWIKTLFGKEFFNSIIVYADCHR